LADHSDWKAVWKEESEGMCSGVFLYQRPASVYYYTSSIKITTEAGKY
jgi:hypothetical protein